MLLLKLVYTSFVQSGLSFMFLWLFWNYGLVVFVPGLPWVDAATCFCLTFGWKTYYFLSNNRQDTIAGILDNIILAKIRSGEIKVDKEPPKETEETRPP